MIHIFEAMSIKKNFCTPHQYLVWYIGIARNENCDSIFTFLILELTKGSTLFVFMCYNNYVSFMLYMYFKAYSSQCLANLMKSNTQSLQSHWFTFVKAMMQVDFFSKLKFSDTINQKIDFSNAWKNLSWFLFD